MAHSERAEQRRRQSWWGLKRPIKRAVALPGINQVAHAVTVRRSGVDAAARLPVPIQVTQVTGRIDGITFVMNDPAQCIIAKELYWGGGMRPRAQDQFALEVFARLAQQAGHVLDVGSYTGVFSIVAAKVNREAPVEAFEIVPSNFLAAWGNVIANDLVGRIEVHLEGVGAEGSIRMPAATAGSALPDFWSIEDAVEGEGVAVPISTLSQVLTRSGADGDTILIKVDVEGQEAPLVTASREHIERTTPTFLMEILPGASVTDLLEVFGSDRSQRPYRYYLITEDRLREASTLRGEDDYRDWLITPLAPESLREAGIAVEELG